MLSALETFTGWTLADEVMSPKNEDSFLYAPAPALIAFALIRVLSKL